MKRRTPHTQPHTAQRTAWDACPCGKAGLVSMPEGDNYSGAFIALSEVLPGG